MPDLIAPIVDLFVCSCFNCSSASSLVSGILLKNLSTFERDTPRRPHNFVSWLFVIGIIIHPLSFYKKYFILFYTRFHTYLGMVFLRRIAIFGKSFLQLF